MRCPSARAAVSTASPAMVSPREAKVPPPTAVISVSPPATRTASSGTSSSSATSCASAVSTPCPWSWLEVMHVMLPEGSRRSVQPSCGEIFTPAAP